MPIEQEIDAVAIRVARDSDRNELIRLAERDSASLPGGALLIAEVDGSIRAALGLESGAIVADPFHRTAELVSLLRSRAEHLQGAAGAGRRFTWTVTRRRVPAPPLERQLHMASGRR